MNKIISLVLLTLASAPAFAEVVPEPESYALLAIGAAAMLVSRGKK